MKIVVVGLGYVGLSNVVLLAQHNEAIGVDIAQDRVDALNARKSPIIAAELSEYLAEKDLNLSASMDLTPRGIRTHLGLNKPIYERTAAFGHFGRAPDADGGFSWERTDLIDALKAVF